jgi:heat shock protein HslJ
MNRLALLLPLALAACARPEAALTPPAEPVAPAEVRPVVASDVLQGRWTVTAVNGKAASRLWLELGAEGPTIVAQRADGGINIGGQQPPTVASLGCNTLRLNGWSRNGDKLVLGIEGSSKTEMGCDAATMTLEQQAHAILRLPMTMELTPPARLRLINEAGTLDLVREQGMG